MRHLVWKYRGTSSIHSSSGDEISPWCTVHSLLQTLQSMWQHAIKVAWIGVGLAHKFVLSHWKWQIQLTYNDCKITVLSFHHGVVETPSHNSSASITFQEGPGNDPTYYSVKCFQVPTNGKLLESFSLSTSWKCLTWSESCSLLMLNEFLSPWLLTI